MNNNFTNTQLIIQYLDGELDNAQVEMLKKSMQDDPALAEEMESLRLTKDAMKSYGVKNRIGSIHTEMMQERKGKIAKQPGILAKILPYSMRIAASILFLIGVSVLYQYYAASPEKLFDENFQAFELHQSRGNAETALQEAYASGDMAATIKLYESLKDHTPENNFLAGNAYLSTHQPAKAIDVFLALQQQNKTGNSHYFEEDTEYYLALAYLLNHQPEQALPIFEKMNTDKNHAYHKKVGNWFLKRAEHLN
jgi:tetratricopeptide (TPR) repeat protein